MKSKGGRRGLSLLETLIAIFIITFAVLEMAALFRSALDGAKRANKVAIATNLANKRMEEIVYWASYDNHFANWGPVDGAQASDSLYPDFVVSSDSEAVTQYSPCSLTEQRFPAGQQRTLSKAARSVRVRVTWAPNESRNKVELYTMVGAPPVVLDEVDVNEAIPNPISPFGSSHNLTVYGLDEDGNKIPDLFFDWSLSAGTGNAELLPARDGRSAILRDQAYNPGTESYEPAPGNATLRVRATYLGLTKNRNRRIVLGP